MPAVTACSFVYFIIWRGGAQHVMCGTSPVVDWRKRFITKYLKRIKIGPAIWLTRFFFVPLQPIIYIRIDRLWERLLH